MSGEENDNAFTIAEQNRVKERETKNEIKRDQAFAESFAYSIK